MGMSERYEIRVQGHIGQAWSRWFDHLTVEELGDGSTVLRGDLPDQAALHGLLNKVRDLGMTLLPGADYRSLLDLKALADDYFVVFYDQRGTGLSPRVEDPGELTYELYLDDLAAFVAHVIYAGLVLWRRSLYPAWVTHLLFNGVELALLLFL
jgi:hypothetical protein